MGLYSEHEGGSRGFALVGGVISGLLFAATMTLVFRRLDLATQAALGDTPAPVRRAALRALQRRRPVPADPEIRAAGVRLAEHQLAQLRRWRIAALVIWSLLLIINVVSLLDDGSLWRLVLIPLYLCLLVYQFSRPRYLRRRIKLLEAAG
ncbi:hypothetical protein [Kribbella sp. CA-293567]|uniref:hypothetical protein n=1 Tax=Kribbella sp. CA-293567 TaxID=3002436 RepID=UPI0022DCFDEE|nr:hypothetical protein [Kribbella sp. CA-293567]WBQ04680.1 hypothetical protein OX958_32550 [Kribbella sp. CA-293567]